MSFIATALIGGIGLAGVGAGGYFGSQGAGSKPNYSNVRDPYQQMKHLVPGLPTMTSTAASNIQNELSGNLPSDVTADIRNAGAAWGVSSGMPGSGASMDVTLQSLGLSSLSEEQQGMGNYLNFLTGVGSQLMPISEQMGVANAAAAPNPQDQYLSSLFGSLGGLALGGVGGGGGLGGGLSSLLGGGTGASSTGAQVDSGSYENWSNPSSISVPADAGTSSAFGTPDQDSALMDFLYGGEGGSGGALTGSLFADSSNQ
jgi:hypothetical protein